MLKRAACCNCNISQATNMRDSMKIEGRQAGLPILHICAILMLAANTGCSTFSQQLFSQSLATSWKKPAPGPTSPERAELSPETVAFLESATIGSSGQITLNDQKLQIVVTESYVSANGRTCKKAVLSATPANPEQQLAICKSPPKEPWRLTRSILSNVVF